MKYVLGKNEYQAYSNNCENRHVRRSRKSYEQLLRSIEQHRKGQVFERELIEK